MDINKKPVSPQEQEQWLKMVIRQLEIENAKLRQQLASYVEKEKSSSTQELMKRIPKFDKIPLSDGDLYYEDILAIAKLVIKNDSNK